MGFKALARKGENGNSGLLSDCMTLGQRQIYGQMVSQLFLPNLMCTFLVAQCGGVTQLVSGSLLLDGAMGITIELVHPINQGNSEASYVTILVLSLKFILQLLIQRNLLNTTTRMQSAKSRM